MQTVYEYGYNSDGVRVWKRDYLARQEYRYICRTGCGGVPMRVYIKEFADTRWLSLSSIHAYLLTLVGGNQLRLMILHIGSALSFMSMDSSQAPAIVYRDSVGIPFGATAEIPNPSFLLPKDHPTLWIPFFPIPPLPVPGKGGIPRPRLPLPVPVPPPSIGGGIQHPPAPNPPVVPPPAPPGFPSPPCCSPTPPGNPPDNPSACEKYESECQGELDDDYNFGECLLECKMCCYERCGPAAYSACAAGCMGDGPGGCGVTVIDPPDIPEDIWDWLEKICELLQAWGVIPDSVPCKTIQWIPLL